MQLPTRFTALLALLAFSIVSADGTDVKEVSPLIRGSAHARRELTIFGTASYCHKDPFTTGNYETISSPLLFSPWHVLHGDKAGQCGDVCEEICDHQDCLADFEISNNGDNCKCISGAPSRCGANTDCSNEVCTCSPGFEGDAIAGCTALSSCFGECDPESVNLADYPQWQEEEGYWIGEYTFYQLDGTPFKSSRWNYRYDAYRGFITGNVQGNAYRQRNVFFYPPQFEPTCDNNNSTQGVGTCGVNGNTKIFSADQQATTCSTNPALGGAIEGPFAGVFETTTELIGADNALLYQVFLSGALFQSQLTTLTVDVETGRVRRTRSAQGFASGVPTSMSFYREQKVNETTFYAEMAATIEEYNILESDTCTWKDNPTFAPPIVGTGLEPGIGGCMAHLEESFEVEV